MSFMSRNVPARIFLIQSYQCDLNTFLDLFREIVPRSQAVWGTHSSCRKAKSDSLIRKKVFRVEHPSVNKKPGVCPFLSLWAAEKTLKNSGTLLFAWKSGDNGQKGRVEFWQQSKCLGNKLEYATSQTRTGTGNQKVSEEASCRIYASTFFCAHDDSRTKTLVGTSLTDFRGPAANAFFYS